MFSTYLKSKVPFVIQDSKLYNRLKSFTALQAQSKRMEENVASPEALKQLRELADKEFQNMVDGNGLAHFVSIVLSAGNFMARTNTSKDAFAFELSALTKLINTKDKDNAETLLHCLIRYFDKKWKGRFTSFMTEDFQHLLPATRIDFLEKISNHIQIYVKQSDGDLLVDKLTPCMVFDADQMARLQKYLCFDAKKYSMDKLFGDLMTFKGHYENSLRDVRRTKEKHVERKQAQGVIDEIEEMLSQGKYRPGSTRTYL
uniref:FH2 domain-containing protein n=1 Tax=Ditylenchus dipsaci TaxID=166011 RepID=A0A915DQH4_9BILA